MDPTTFRRWYDAIAPDLLRYMAQACRDADAAADLVQEAFSRFLQSGFCADVESENTRYLYRVATNLMRDRWRRTRRWRIGPLEERSGPSPEERYTRRLDLERAMMTLRLRDRALLWLAYGEGRSHAEIAAILELQPGSVRVLLFRARSRVHRILEGEEP